MAPYRTPAPTRGAAQTPFLLDREQRQRLQQGFRKKSCAVFAGRALVILVIMDRYPDHAAAGRALLEDEAAQVATP